MSSPPIAPDLRTRQPFTTFFDAVQYLFDTNDYQEQSTRERSLCRRAATQALENLAAYNDSGWKCYLDILTMTIPGRFSTGTIAYDDETNEATLTGGTWPEWAYHGDIWIDNIRYSVDSRVSDSVVLLSATNSPSYAFADKSYKLTAGRTPLPTTVHSMNDIIVRSQRNELASMTLEELLNHEIRFGGSGSSPLGFCITGDSRFSGGLVLHVTPSPELDTTLSAAYRRKPRALTIYDFFGNDATLSGNQVTIASGTFTDNHIGCVIRFSSNDDKPASRYGTAAEENDNVFYAERVITKRVSGTVVEIDQEVTGISGSVGYQVSSLVDVAPGPMMNAYFSLCELILFESLNFDSKTLASKERQFAKRLQLAMASDRVTTGFIHASSNRLERASLVGTTDVL